MNSKEAQERFIELKTTDNKINCTDSELNDFLSCGLIIKTNKGYITRNNDELKIKVVKSKSNDFDLDFGIMIDNAYELTKHINQKKVFFVTERCYNKYKENNKIVKQKEQEFFKDMSGDLWLIVILEER